jgi:type IV pilus assembly protein PilY1
VDANGQLHVVNIDPSSRPATGIGPPDPTPTFPITVSGQRVYGQITIAGQTAFFSTAAKPVTDPLSVDPGSGGATYQLDLGNAAGAFGGSSLPYFSTQALYGGVSVYYDASAGATHVLGLQVAQLSQTIVTNAPTNAALATNSNKGLLYQLLGWVRRALN